jgi:hypothetical protein
MTKTSKKPVLKLIEEVDSNKAKTKDTPYTEGTQSHEQDSIQ